MARTKIEWCDYTVNPVKGKCPVACPYCYARRLYDRFKWDSDIRLDLGAFQPLRTVKTPSRVFVGSTIELFGDWIPRSWMIDIMSLCDSYKRAGHQFLFLTKRPQDLLNWSPLPDNCWAGVSITNRLQAHDANFYLPIIKAPVKFISFEPLLDDVMAALYCWNTIRASDWVIIGQQTPATRQTSPKVPWLERIIATADGAHIPVFLKDNLLPILPENDVFYRPTVRTEEVDIMVVRQEIPRYG